MNTSTASPMRKSRYAGYVTGPRSKAPETGAGGWIERGLPPNAARQRSVTTSATPTVTSTSGSSWPRIRRRRKRSVTRPTAAATTIPTAIATMRFPVMPIVTMPA